MLDLIASQGLKQSLSKGDRPGPGHWGRPWLASVCYSFPNLFLFFPGTQRGSGFKRRELPPPPTTPFRPRASARAWLAAQRRFISATRHVKQTEGQERASSVKTGFEHPLSKNCLYTLRKNAGGLRLLHRAKWFLEEGMACLLGSRCLSCTAA